MLLLTCRSLATWCEDAWATRVIRDQPSDRNECVVHNDTHTYKAGMIASQFAMANVMSISQGSLRLQIGMIERV